MRRLLPLLAAVVAATALVACGGGGPDVSDGSASPTTGAARDSDWCNLLEADEPTDELVDAVPARHRRAAEIVVRFSTLLGGLDDDGGDPELDVDVDGLAGGIVGEVERLDAFAEAVQSTCPSAGDEAVEGLRLLTAVANMASEDRDDAYCTALAASFGSDGGVEAIAALAAEAPGSHRVALEGIVALGEGPGVDDPAAQTEWTAGFMGLGLYAESLCDIEDAFAQMMLAAAFLSMGDGFGETNAGDIGTEPPAADPAAAAALVPAGTDVSFEVRTVDLDDEGERRASVVVPAGWEVDDTMGVRLEPPTGSAWGFFTSMDVDAGCDGMCEVTDWRARLRGEDGYLTGVVGGATVTEDRPTADGRGAVVTTASESGDVRGVVVRWDDAVDHYFRCAVDLDADDAALLPAFVAACEASRPNWFAVS